MMPPSSRLIAAAALGAALLAAAVPPASACTVFRLDAPEGPVVGRNYDWDVDAGLVLVNKRGVTRFFDLDPAPDGARWTSRHGSLTFNQYGRDFPQGGINEAGLVVAMLWLNGTEFPPPDGRPELDAPRWIQYQLDRAASVPEVLRSLDEVRIRSTVEVHFFVSDRAGRSAAVEFLGGEAVVHAGGSMPVPVLTNHTYEASLDRLRRHEREGVPPAAGGTRSLERFVRAAAAAAAYDPGRHGDPAAHASGILRDVAQGDHTKWSIVYDSGRGLVRYRTHRQPETVTVDLDALDFDCASPVPMADVNAPPAPGGGPRWTPYTRDANRTLVTRTFAETSILADTPPGTLERVAGYPERSFCGP